MKSSFLKYTVVSLIFLLMLFCAVFFVRPVYSKIVNELENFAQYLLQSVGDKLGVTISYESLSPSIFSSVEVKGIQLKNADSGQMLLNLNRVSVKYKWLPLLKGNYDEAVKEVVFEGGELSFSKETDMPLVLRIKELLDANKTEKSTANIFLPFVLSLENITCTYEDARVKAQLFIKKASLVPDVVAKISRLELSSTAEVSVALGSLGTFSGTHRVACDISAHGTSTADLQNISSQIAISSVKFDKYSLAKFSFLFSYDGEAAELRMVQNLLPLNIQADWVKATSEAHIRLDADKLDLFEFLPVQAYSAQLHKLSGSLFSGVYTAALNTATKAFSYAAEGSFFASDSLVRGSLSAEYALSGNAESINVKKLSLVSDMVSGVLQGSGSFKTLQMQGSANIRSFRLPNGNKVAAEIFITPQENVGSVLVIPRLALGTQTFKNVSLSAAPNSTLDGYMFALSFSDGFGSALLEGSLQTGKEKLADVHFSTARFGTSSVLRAASFCVDKKTQKTLRSLSDGTAGFTFGAEAFFSSDFTTYMLNVPQLRIDTNKRKNEYLSFALTGNERLFSVSNLVMEYAGQLVEGDIQIDIGQKFSDVILSTTLQLNGIPYNLAGTYVPDGYISLLGEYNLEAYMDLSGGDGERLGSIKCTELPIKLSKMLFSATAEASFTMLSAENWLLQFPRLELQEVSGFISAKPRFTISGSASNSGLMFETISYIDSVSSLSGSGSVTWNYAENVLDGIAANMQLVNPFSAEQIMLTLSAANPDRKPLASSLIDSDYYFSAELGIENFSLSRIFPRQNSADILTASVTASGTLADPLVSVQVPFLLASVGGYPLEASGGLLYADGKATVESLHASYRDQRLENVVLDFSPKKFTGVLTADIMSVFFANTTSEHSLRVPLVLSCSTPDENFKGVIPENFKIALSVAGITGTLINVPDAYTYELTRTGSRYDLKGGKNKEVSGYFMADTGQTHLKLQDPSPATGSISGIINRKDNKIMLSIRDFAVDMGRIKGILTYPVFAMHEGLLSGTGSITGLLSDPEFNGDFTISQLTVGIPQFLTETVHADKIPLKIEQSTFLIEPVVVKVEKGMVLFDAFAYFDRWRFDTLSMNIKTLEDTSIAGRVDLAFMNAYGDASGNLLIEVTLDDVNVAGALRIDHGSAELLILNKDDAATTKSSKMETKLDLQLEIGEKTEVVYPTRKNPIFWGQIVPHTKLTVKMDTSVDEFDFKGDVSLRGGEILYIGRNFYLKEGRLVFNANQDSVDPRVTIKAEIRERDKDGKLIRITLSAENQLLSQLSPTLSATPAKSEAEIMELLGQAILADTVNSDSPLQELAIGLMDYGAQVAVFRQVERQLRKVLKFDIFSFRTFVLQKAMLQALNVNKQNKQVSIGNFLDNSTVYVGKYFGSAIYADAMLQLVYDDTKFNANNMFSGLRVQPEIGLEMNSPFATIRWSIAPDVATFKNLWVPYSTISLSWKFQL